MFNKTRRGFTVIELLVVIATIAVLASIVLVNVNSYLKKGKIARANADAASIEKALVAFNATYGNFPISGGTEIFTSDPSLGGPGNPYLTVNGTNKYLSEFYPDKWDTFNAKYFSSTGFYLLELCSVGGVNIDCGQVILMDNSGSNIYGQRSIIGQNCDCGYSPSTYGPFRSTPY